jgi:hypothetical protein
VEATAHRRLGLVLLLAALLAWGALYVARTGFVYAGEPVFSLWDDAMISMRYARNLAAGHGLVWNPGGERVQGFSDPLPTLAMAALHALPVGPRWTSLLFQLVALAAACASLALVWRLALRLAPERPGTALAAALATALCAPLQIWALQGADSVFVGAWLLGCLCALPARDDPRPGRFALLLGLGAAIRPDAAVFAVAVLAGSLAAPGRRTRRLALGVLALAGVLAALFAFGWLYYGDPLPNTYYLKASGSPRALVLRSGLEQLGARLPGLAPALVLAAVAAWRRRRDPLALAMAGCIAAGFATDVATGGDWLASDYGSRYAMPALPLLLLLALDGAAPWLEALARGRPPALRAAPGLVLAAALSLAASPATARREWLDPRAPTLLQAVNVLNYRYAVYLREHTRPDTSVALHWAGVTGYFAERPAVDVLGRCDRHIAKLRVDRFLPGHSKWDWPYVLREQRPDVFVEVSRGLLDLPEFRSEYFEARGDGLAFFLRRESLAKLLDPKAEIVDLALQRRPRPASRGRGEEGPGGPL